MKQMDLTLYLVTDRTGFSEDAFLKKIEEALSAGVTLLQLREKEQDGRAFYQLAKCVKQLADAYSVPLIINDRIDIALAVDAAGVHVGQNDIPVYVARQLLGPNKIVGATTKTVEQAINAQEEGADYLGVGAIYPTTTKVKTQLTSPATLRDITQRASIPAAAIGGLNQNNLDILRGTGIKGICVVSAIMKSDAITETVRTLRTASSALMQT